MQKMLTFVALLIALSLTSCTAQQFVCEGRSEGFHPDPTDCGKFYRCVTGRKFSFDCGPGTHFNPDCDCCDWPHNVRSGCGESGGEQPSRYQQPASNQVSGYDSSQSQTGQSFGQQSGHSYRQYGQQPSAQSGQEDPYQQYWQPSGQGLGQSQGYGQQPVVQPVYDPNQQQYRQQSGQQSGQSYGQYPQSGQTYGQQPVAQSGQVYGQQPVAQSGQTFGRQPQYNQYGEYGGYGQPSVQTVQTVPSPEDDRSPNQRPNRVYKKARDPKTDRRGEQLPQESDDIYEEEEPKRQVRPKPRPQPKANRREENVLIEDNEEFDHKFDEPIEERRPKPKPRPRQETRRRVTTTPEPSESEEGDDEDVEEITTTRRPRVPKRKHRPRVTTPTTTTEGDDSSEDNYNDFSKFEEQLSKKAEDIDNDDVNKWLIEDPEPTTTTTTEDPYVSMLKERVPPQPRNRSRTDRNRGFGRRLGTTTPAPTTTADEVTTPDPFDKEWRDFIAGKNDQNRDQRPDSSSKTKSKDKKKKTPKATDPLLMSDVISYFNCTEAGKSCDVCEELDWIKYSGTGLQSTPFRSFKFLPRIASKQCYKACSESQQCVAFAYSLSTGMCHIYDQTTTDDIQANKEYNTVLKNPKNIVMNEEWMHTKNGLMSGRELYSVKLDNVWDCLQECVNDMEYCLAVNYDMVESKCRVYDAYEGNTVNTVKANTVSLQHLSLFEDNDQWRFEDIGHKTLANGQVIETKPVKDSEECFYECMENLSQNCSFVTIEEKKSEDDDEEDGDEGSVDLFCHTFAFNSTPKWVRSRNRSNHSYVLSVPKNHSLVQSYPGYSYVGNPVEIKEGLTEEECRQYAEKNCRFCRKYTAVVETKECALFSDSALLSPALKDLNYTEKSGLLSMPKDSEYMAFKRIPWKMFVTDVRPYELKGEINGQKCLQFCLQQKTCLATALVYDTVDSSMFCYFFKESDLKNSNTTEYENVDLFVKLMDQKEIPGQVVNGTDDCSDGQPLDSAVKNVNDLNANLDSVSPKKSSADSGRYHSQSYPLSPHGYEYSGGPDEEDAPYSERNSRKQGLRNVRSVNRNKFQESEENEFDSDVRPSKRKIKVIEEIEDPLAFIERVKQNALKTSVLDRIPTLSSEIRKKVKQNKLDSLKTTDEEGVQKRPDTRTQPKGAREGRVDRLSDDCDNENEFNFDSNRCKDKTEVKDVSKMCTKLPKIIYSDHKLMQSCNETLVGEDCPVVCRAGFEATEDKIKCESAGHRNVWTNSKQIKCKPIESQCETVDKREGAEVRIKATTKYPEEKVHFFTKFDTNRKLPQFSAYVHTKENNLNKSILSSNESTEYLQNSCEELDEKQSELSDYKESTYIPKPLLPRNAFLYSNTAQGLVNTMSNVAPQDVFTSRGPWLTLENRTLEMLKSRPGIVVSGVCPQSIPGVEDRHNRNRKTTDKTLEIPKCFWSIYCVPLGEGVTTGVFYGENTHPISQLEKQSRVDQIKQYRDQRFIVKLLGTDGYKQIWTEVYQQFKNLNKGIKPFIVKCAENDKISPEGMAFWDTVINGEENAEQWQSKFKYGLEKNEPKNKRKSGSTGDELSDGQVSKRRERDDQNSDVEKQILNSIEDIIITELGLQKKCQKKIIGYLTPSGDKSFTEVEGKALTHAILAHIDIDSDGNLGPFEGQSTEKMLKLYEMLAVKTRLSATGHNLKTMVSIGGWNDSEHLSTIARTLLKRNTLITDVLTAIEYWNLDGIEIDWKYPVKGGAKPGNQSDRANFVLLLTELRQSFDAYGRGKGLKDRLLLSITGSSGVWMIEDSYDLEGILPVIDWINVLTYDYFGPWKSKWGANTGPNAPLYQSAPISSLKDMNVDSTLQKYYCLVNSSSKLVMSIPFYGHYWNNVGDPLDTTDTHFRDAHPVGGFVTYNNIKNKWLLNIDFKQLWHNKSYTPYLWSESQRVFLSYENKESVQHKVRYAVDHRLGGVSIWALDFDDTDNELLNTIVDSYRSCHISYAERNSGYVCEGTPVKKWWSPEGGKNVGLCGRSAPLIDGFYPICDPNSESMSCCSSWGRCGSGPQFCECKGCVDYKKNPELKDKEPVKPSHPVRWLTSDQMPEGEEGEGIPICGPKAIKLNGSHPICNPDDDNAHCCSAGGLCGTGSLFCECEDCVDFRQKPDFSYRQKLWWDQTDGHSKALRCGKLSPKIDGFYPICDPESNDTHCCGKWGTCGSGPINCECKGCLDFKKRPEFRWK